MLPDEFGEIGKLMLEDFGLCGWKIILHPKFEGVEALSTIAYTSSSIREIHISLKAMENYDYNFCLNTLRHELSHAVRDTEIKRGGYRVRGYEKAHSKEWRECAFNCGVYKEDLHPYSRERNRIIRKLHKISHE